MRNVKTIVAIGFLVAGFAGAARAQTGALPNPVLYLTRVEPYTSAGKQFLRYRYEISNADAYPAELFAASPTLPPCGKNTRASRTWVDFFDQSGRRLYGFCALGGSADLNSIFFAAEADVVPPSWIYVEFTDRKTNTKYRSNLAETTL